MRPTVTPSPRSATTRRRPSASFRSSCWSGFPRARVAMVQGRTKQMEGPPPQYTAKTLDDYLEHLSKGVFQAGISWRVVAAKWPTITKAFHGFNVERVARMTDRDVDALVKDERVIRSRPKIAAVVHNANEMLTLERAGGFKKHLRSFPEYETLATDLRSASSSWGTAASTTSSGR